jgi:hypothetical protein
MNSGFSGNPDWKSDGPRFGVAVFIAGFFGRGRNFAYYVVGEANIAALQRGTTGTRAYDGPILAAPTKHHSPDIVQSSDLVPRIYLSGYDAKWMYLFETARLAWKKLLVDPRKVEKVRAMEVREFAFACEELDRKPSTD